MVHVPCPYISVEGGRGKRRGLWTMSEEIDIIYIYVCMDVGIYEWCLVGESFGLGAESCKSGVSCKYRRRRMVNRVKKCSSPEKVCRSQSQ